MVRLPFTEMNVLYILVGVTLWSRTVIAIIYPLCRSVWRSFVEAQTPPHSSIRCSQVSRYIGVLLLIPTRYIQQKKLPEWWNKEAEIWLQAVLRSLHLFGSLLLLLTIFGERMHIALQALPSFSLAFSDLVPFLLFCLLLLLSEVDLNYFYIKLQMSVAPTTIKVERWITTPKNVLIIWLKRFLGPLTTFCSSLFSKLPEKKHSDWIEVGPIANPVQWRFFFLLNYSILLYRFILRWIHNPPYWMVRSFFLCFTMITIFSMFFVVFIDQNVFNTLFLLFSEWMFTVWLNDPPVPAHQEITQHGP